MSERELVPGTQWPLMKSLEASGVLEALSKVPASKLVPSANDVFNALACTPPEKVKVIALGQDPYIKGEAHGLAFSSKTYMTPSLITIFKELELEGITRVSPNLTDWAEQGVLLLNTILTAEFNNTLAHERFGWQEFTKAVVRYVVNLGNPLVLMLWGRHAQDFWADLSKTIDLDFSNIRVLEAYHPVAENRSSGKYKFTGCNHFTLANDFLTSRGVDPIKWNDV